MVKNVRFPASPRKSINGVACIRLIELWRKSEHPHAVSLAHSMYRIASGLVARMPTQPSPQLAGEVLCVILSKEISASHFVEP
ncbi:hypothetical protein WI27_18500 [Burkholderia cepacia]|nr:hypothetical protein WI27_18500 [Burkholderia cepacia]